MIAEHHVIRRALNDRARELLHGDGTLTVVQADKSDKYSVLETVATQRGARTMILDEKTHLIYLMTADFGPPPAPTPERPRPRPSIVPGTFAVLIIGR